MPSGGRERDLPNNAIKASKAQDPPDRHHLDAVRCHVPNRARPRPPRLPHRRAAVCRTSRWAPPAVSRSAAVCPHATGRRLYDRTAADTPSARDSTFVREAM
ncbi:hypothetical protein Acsp04_45190 [Actinomadura sp. NBRC 104425]|nr:hypothetical protein Acsp04_45190 [Actinomadura sp. NBRC 104425]